MQSRLRAYVALLILSLSAPLYSQQDINETEKAYLADLSKATEPGEIAGLSFKLGKLYSTQAQYDRALEFLQKARKAHEELNDQKASGLDWNEISQVEMNQGKFPKAIEDANQAVKIHEGTGNKSGLADALRITAEINRRTAKLDQALESARKSFALAEEAGDAGIMASALNVIALVQNDQGNFDEALDTLSKSLPLAEQSQDPRQISAVLATTGVVQGTLGNRPLALDYFERSLKLREQLQDQLGVASMLNNIGVQYYNLGEYAQALEYYKRSLHTLEALKDRGRVAMSLNNIGVVQYDLGDYDQALENYRSSLQIKEELGDKKGAAISLNNIGLVYQDLGKHEAALTEHQESLKIRQELADPFGTSMSLNNIGMVQKDLGNYQEALKFLNEALAIREKIGDKRGLAWTLLSIGEIQHKRNEMDEAEQNLSAAIRISQEINNPETWWPALHEKALVLGDRGKPAEAESLLKEAIGVIENVRSKLTQAEQKAGFLQNKLDVYEDLIALLSVQKKDEAFHYAQRAKARAFLDLLEESRAAANINEGVDPDLLKREREIQAKLSLIQRKRDQEPDQAKRNQMEKSLDELYDSYADLKAAIKIRNPAYADLKYSEPVDLAEAQSVLPSNALLLEYLLGKSRSYLFAVSRDNYELLELPPRAEIEKRVEKFRQSISDVSNPSAQAFCVQEAAALYGLLVKPARKLLRGKTQLIVAPDGLLHYLPFPALLTSTATAGQPVSFSDLPYLVKLYDIRSVQSASILKTLQSIPRHQAKNQKKLLAFADPVSTKDAGDADYVMKSAYGQEGQPLQRLRYSAQEVERIARLYPEGKADIRLGDQATERNLKETQLDRYERVHFAVHGIANENKPQFSSIVLGRGDDTKEDGYLQMYEIFNLRLNADLVVLSACDSGLGKEVRGEGIIGLTRAFLYAGADSVIVSLWKIDDESTAVFMQDFYENLDKAGKEKALRKAQLRMIAAGVYSHPFFWSPFVLYGKN